MFQVINLCREGLCGISFSLAASELVCLSGPSGAGKTLLLRALADLDPHTGRLILEGTEHNDMPAIEWRSKVALLAADSRWWEATVGEHFGKIDQQQFAALGFDTDTSGWNVERLSSGERQRLALLRLLANRPRVLLLDEPTANLDRASSHRVEQLIAEYLVDNRAACLWVTHSHEQAQRIAARRFRLNQQGLQPETGP